MLTQIKGQQRLLEYSPRGRNKMGWKNITKASVSYNLSKEWFWSNDDEYERIMKADDKKVESGTTDLGDKIKDYEFEQNAYN